MESRGAANGGAIVGNVGLSVIGLLVHGRSADNYGGALIGAGRAANSIFWNNTDANGSSTSRVKADLVEYSCVQDMLVGEPGEDPPDPEKFSGCTALDPTFVDAATGDFHLLPGSPRIDAGDNGARPSFVALDLDGGPRFVEDPASPNVGVGPPPIADMGPFEYSPAMSHRGRR